MSSSKRVFKGWYALGLLLWLVAGFGISQIIIVGILMLLDHLGVTLVTIDAAVLDTVTAACAYLLTLGIVIGVPWWLRHRATSRADMGIARLPSWMDIALAPAGFVIYFLLSAIIIRLLIQFVPGFDADELQNVGFKNLTQQYEYVLAFVTLVVVAPLAEEMLFRGYLYGKLRRAVPIWVAILLTSGLFGFIHGQWNVGIDVFFLSLAMCTLREVTGSIWAGVLLHMIKNGLAFYLLFINPSLLHTIGG